MKRIFAMLILCALMMSFAACNVSGETASSGDKFTQSETAGVETDVIYCPVPPGSNWEGVYFYDGEVNVLAPADQRFSSEWECKEKWSNLFERSVLRRNKMVEEELDVRANVTYTESGEYSACAAEISERVLRDVNNKLGEIDAVANIGFEGMTAALRDCYANIGDKELFPYFDFSLLCWNKSLAENGSVNGKMYVCAGEINTSMFDSASVMWHNMTLYDSIKSEKDPENIQELALEGEWTYDELYKWSSYYDEHNKMYGLYVPPSSIAMPYAWQLELISAKEDGTHEYRFLANEKAEQALVNFQALYNAEGNLYTKEIYSEDEVYHYFSDVGNLLFMNGVLRKSESVNKAICEMYDDYAILPIPKYDKEQIQYVTTCTEPFTTISVLERSENAEKYEMISAYLQCTAEKTYNYSRGYYYEEFLQSSNRTKDKYGSADVINITMFVTVVDNIQFNFAHVHAPMLRDVMDLWCRAGEDGRTLAELYAADSTLWEALNELNDWYFEKE